MKVETVERQGKEYVLVPREQYNQFLEDAEMLRDIREFREAKTINEETYPGEIVNRLILNEESPIRVYRDHRGLTQQQLADKCGIQRAYLAEIETGRKSGSVKTLKAIAAALDVDLTSIS